MVNWVGEAIDTTLSLSGKYGRWLNVRKNRWCFIVWIVVCLGWIVRDLQLHLYSQAFFCLPSIALHAYGFWNWGKENK